MPSLTLSKDPKEHLSKDTNQFLSREDKVSEIQVIDAVSEADMLSYVLRNATPDKLFEELNQEIACLWGKLKDIPGTEKQGSQLQQRKESSDDGK